MQLSPGLAEAEWSEFLPFFYRIEAQRSGFDPERRKEGAEMQLSPGLAEVEWSEFLPTRGCTGFDGGVEAGIAGGCAYHP